MESIASYRESFEKYARQQAISKEPEGLYEPIHYILGLGGKRLRPVLALIACSLFDDDFEKALPAALAIEIFHNFTLVHDDIMDDAPLRRGHQTVHEKWDINTGILSGDAMLITAYIAFEGYPPERFRELVRIFNKTALEVCEGQQRDIDFEKRSDVDTGEYIQMITEKTAVLVAAALKIGALIGGASASACESCYQFGKNIGIAFQLQDDYLDAFGDSDTFGKKTGGDILENKKTFLFIQAIKGATKEQRETLLNLYSDQSADSKKKVEMVKEIFTSSGAAELTLKAVREYTENAFVHLRRIDVPDQKKSTLREFAEQLMVRKV